MQSTHRSPKDKGRAMEEDYAQSFASLSLSDCGDHPTPSNDSYDPYPSHTDAEGSYYTATAHGSHPPEESSVAAYEPFSIDGIDWLDTSATSSTRWSDLQPHFTAASPVTSLAKWIELQSLSSEALSAPSAHSKWTDVKDSISRQRPPIERYQLPCEFHNLTGCDRMFPGDEVQDWMDHIEGHLQSKFPTRLRCWFCSEHDFDARETSEGDVRSNFNMRMHHIRHHIVYDGYRPEQMLKDGFLIKHLLDRNLIDRRTYESIVTPKLPPIPGSQGRHRHHRLPQVEEEVVTESSSRHHNRSEKHHRDRREYGGGHHRGRKSKLSARHRYPSERISAPSVDHRDDAVLRSLRQPPSSPYSSSNVLGNTSLEGSSVSNRNTTSGNTAGRNSKDRSVGHAGDETATNTVADELRQNDTALAREASDGSPGRIEPPRSQDCSDDGPSSCPTDTSTPESDSFWLAEYSEDENKRLDEGHVFVQFSGFAVERVFEAFRSWKGDLSEGDLPCDDVGESDPASKQDKGKSKASAPGKRALADQSESSITITGSSGPSSNRVRCSKRRRTSDRQRTFACPYTKKDPMSYRDCYKYKLSRIRDVKQHLARCHRKPPYCPRCMGIFEGEDERDEHIREISCPLRPSIRLDGITESQKSQLAKKSAPNASPEAQWFAVFDIVFPGHKPRPASPYVDSELLQDITHYQNFLTSRGPRIISEVLAQQGVVTWHLPNEEHDLAAFQQTIFEEGLGIIFEQWLARRSSSSQDSTVASGSGSSAQNTPPSSSHSRERVAPNAVHDTRAVPPVTVDNPPDGGSADALSEGENIPENSADHLSFGEGLDETFGFEDSGFGSPAGPTYDIDEMMRLFMDDAQASSEFRPDLG